MPTYEFRCPNGHEFEKFYRSISGAPMEVACPTCGKNAERLMSAGGGLVFKGSGFYITDYGKDGKKPQTPPVKTGEGVSASSTGSGTESSRAGSSESGSGKGDSKTGGDAKPSGDSKSGGDSKSAAATPPATPSKSAAKGSSRRAKSSE